MAAETKSRGIILLAVLIVLAAGCASHTTPVVTGRQLSQSEQDFQAIWSASQEVLRRYDFPIERQDRRAGIITTGQLTGQHFFELWRDDAAAFSDLAEGSLQTIYRAATVTITADSAGAFFATVDVHAWRSDRAQPQVTNTTEAYDLFSGTATREFIVQDRLAEADASDRVSLGRDEKLAAKLLAEINLVADRKRAGLD